MQSVAALHYPNIEYVVVDGASSDGTLELLQGYKGLLTRWVSEPDDGIYDAMNKGIAMATGDWVVMMNAGDTFAASDVLDRIFQEERYSADVLYGDVIKDGAIKTAEPPHNSHRMFFCHQSALMRRTLLLQYPFDTRHRLSADFKQIKQLFLAGYHFVQLPYPVACFDTTGISNKHRSKGLRDNIAVVRETDSKKEQLRLLPKLWFVYAMCRLRGK